MPHTFLPEEIVLGLYNFVWSFKLQKKNKIHGEEKFGTPPKPPGGPFLVFFSPCVHEKPKRIHEHRKIATEWIKLENTHLPPPKHVRRKNSASVDGGPSGGSSLRRPVSEDPHRR